MENTEHRTGDRGPRVVVIVCSWCSSISAELAGSGRNQYPGNVRVVRVPCAGRVDALYIVKALQNSADGVLVFGCNPGDCHYLSGNLLARRRFALIKNLLEYIGIEPERVQFSWISGSEGSRFAALVEKVVEDVKRLGPAKKLVKADV